MGKISISDRNRLKKLRKNLSQSEDAETEQKVEDEDVSTKKINATGSTLKKKTVTLKKEFLEREKKFNDNLNKSTQALKEQLRASAKTLDNKVKVEWNLDVGDLVEIKARGKTKKSKSPSYGVVLKLRNKKSNSSSLIYEKYSVEAFVQSPTGTGWYNALHLVKVN